MLLPVPLVSQIVGYLQRQPYGDVAPLVAALQACAAVQMPDAHSQGQCPAVTAALAERGKPAPAQRPSQP